MALELGEIDRYHAVLVGLQIGQQHRIMFEKIETREIVESTTARGISGLSVPGSILGFLKFLGQILKFTSLGCVLPPGTGFTNSPRVEKQARTGKHIAGELGGVFAVQDVAVFLTNVAFLHIERARPCQSFCTG